MERDALPTGTAGSAETGNTDITRGTDVDEISAGLSAVVKELQRLHTEIAALQRTVENIAGKIK
jgi:hypothetical protein